MPKPKRSLVLILDDDDDRVRRFRTALRRIDPALRLRSWKDTRKMKRALADLLPQTALISLDHDLKWLNGAPLLGGDGADVARHMATLSPACPVIVHTDNCDCAPRMCGVLRRAGWKCSRVVGEGEEWIERKWSRCVRRRLRQVSEAAR
jgi:CheY-like chemotaxis protein